MDKIDVREQESIFCPYCGSEYPNVQRFRNVIKVDSLVCDKTFTLPFSSIWFLYFWASIPLERIKQGYKKIKCDECYRNYSVFLFPHYMKQRLSGDVSLFNNLETYDNLINEEKIPLENVIQRIFELKIFGKYSGYIVFAILLILPILLIPFISQVNLQVIIVIQIILLLLTVTFFTFHVNYLRKFLDTERIPVLISEKFKTSNSFKLYQNLLKNQRIFTSQRLIVFLTIVFSSSLIVLISNNVITSSPFIFSRLDLTLLLLLITLSIIFIVFLISFFILINVIITSLLSSLILISIAVYMPLKIDPWEKFSGIWLLKKIWLSSLILYFLAVVIPMSYSLNKIFSLSALISSLGNFFSYPDWNIIFNFSLFSFFVISILFIHKNLEERKKEKFEWITQKIKFFREKPDISQNDILSANLLVAEYERIEKVDSYLIKEIVITVIAALLNIFSIIIGVLGVSFQL